MLSIGFAPPTAAPLTRPAPRRSIVGFLKSPEWSVPVMEYIDKNCVVFDTEDENKFEYTTIHAAFCEMVNSLLEGFL